MSQIRSKTAAVKQYSAACLRHGVLSGFFKARQCSQSLDAAQVADEASFSVGRTGDRAAALRESLAGELEEARLVVQAAAAARQRAERDVERLEEDIASLHEEEQTRKVCIYVRSFVAAPRVAHQD